MSLLKLPEIKADARIGSAQFDMRPDALERWEPGVCAAVEDAASISIYEQIGASWDGSGITASRISAILRNIGARDVVVNVNSPGGDFFEGVAIYNLLRQHKAKVTVQVMGLAASAASVIAMAGDEILMGDGSFLMIHNAWAVAVGNRHDFLAASDQLAPFDQAMAEVYAARSGMSVDEAAAMMDKETWIGATQAVKDGFATGMVDRSNITQDAKAQGSKKYLALVEASMARAGHSRSVRRDALKSLFSGTPGAAENSTTPSAGQDVAASLQSLLNNMKGSQ
ncbi:head maturation protease, ClpP-related [Massilia sp. DWR3-1-1]|uniref:head maturation protease, ClpP-related n=1 Tax=Massilia sp. DWR3-1-1 TaxID=2804559 RepID=UPI003CFA1EE6